MKRGPRFSIAALLMAALALLTVASWPGEKEPQYKGMKLSEWLFAYRFGANTNGPTQAQVEDAVRHIGTNALPFLVEWLGYQQPRWRDNLAAEMRRVRIPFTETAALRLIGTGRYRAGLAVFGFEILRDKAATAVPALTGLLGDCNSPYRAERAVVALVYIGQEAVPALLTVVTNKAVPAPFRCRVTRCLTDPLIDLGTNAIRAVPILLPALDDPAVASCAAQVLGVLRLVPDKVVPALTRCLRSPDLGTRAEAAYALAYFGVEASSAVPDLQAAAADKEQTVRDTVTNALRAIAPQVLKNGEH